MVSQKYDSILSILSITLGTHGLAGMIMYDFSDARKVAENLHNVMKDVRIQCSSYDIRFQLIMATSRLRKSFALTMLW